MALLANSILAVFLWKLWFIPAFLALAIALKWRQAFVPVMAIVIVTADIFISLWGYSVDVLVIFGFILDAYVILAVLININHYMAGSSKRDKSGGTKTISILERKKKRPATLIITQYRGQETSPEVLGEGELEVMEGEEFHLVNTLYDPPRRYPCFIENASSQGLDLIAVNDPDHYVIQVLYSHTCHFGEKKMFLGEACHAFDPSDEKGIKWRIILKHIGRAREEE